MLNLIIFGPPGAGKGTQSEKLAEKYGLVHLSTGAILRTEAAMQTELGCKAKKLMDRGELVPDHVVVRMLNSIIQANPSAGGFIFDGFPRTIAQAKALDRLLSHRACSISVMLYIEVDEEILINRILNRGKDSGRPDDQDISIVRNRITEYNKKTAPLKEYYRKQKKYRIIKGKGSIEEVCDKLCAEINSPNNSIT